MELVVLPAGCVPHFPFQQFDASMEEYKQQQDKVCWKDWRALREFCTSAEDNPANIVGYIDAETSKKWLDWDLGDLFDVACWGSFVFCAKN